MKRVLEDIQSGRFARDWVTECRAGQPSFKAMRRRSAGHSIEEVGAKLRGMMPWITANPLVDKAKRPEEHTSEPQSLMRNTYAVFCLKKKTTTLNYFK